MGSPPSTYVMRMLAALLGVVVLLTACTIEPAPGPLPTRSRAVHPAVPRSPDRDEQAVAATLASMNPCLLVGGGKVRTPHVCLIRDDDVQVRFVERTDRAQRFLLPVKELDGARVDSIRATDDSCSLEIPVSFRYAVRIGVLAGADRCGTAEGYAKKVIARLDTPAKAQHKAARPDLRKFACPVLIDALAGLQGRTNTDPHTTGDLDRCRLSSGTRLSLLVEPGPPQGGRGERWTTISGKTIYVDDDCQWTWSEGPFDADADRLVTAEIPHCDAEVGKRFVAALIAELDAPPAEATVPRLTYRPGDPDEPNPGACVDHPSTTCDPYQPTKASKDAALSDPHAACAAAVDAVHAQFPELKPVVAPRCSFVEPSHALQLDLRIGSDRRPYGTKGLSRPLMLGGHAATYREWIDLNRDPSALVCVDSGDRGLFWCLTATFRASRDQPDGPVDTGGRTKLEPIMRAVAEQYL